MAAAGDRVDKFTLVRQLGAGGMGETWEAVRQTGHDFEQRVAIKLADQDVIECPEGLEAFRREASLAASLRHPNIAAVLDIDERGGYLVCELVDGADLRSVLRAAPGGKLAAPVLVHLVGQIARGLSHAHRRILRGQLSPVIHRDMSPGNVVVDYDGNVKIVDFGIAKATAVSADVSEAIKGKLSYMAPEQAMGTRMDGRADQYALGVIAYEALSGVRPNDGPHEGATLACILGGKHVPLLARMPRVDPALATIVERMLALHPDQRFKSMEAVLEALVPFTPPFTVHRELIPLVMRARQPHTIMRENGAFVSRPVAVEPAAVEPASPPHDHAPEAAAASPANRGYLVDAAAAPPESPRRTPVPALVEPLAATRAPKGNSAPALRAGSGSVASAQPAVVRRWRAAMALDRLLASRGFWQALTVLGAVLLFLVAWVALSPEALLRLAPVSPARVTEVAEASGARPGWALARVTVSPGGRVWIDQQLRGVASPVLEVSLPAGPHLIAVGREVPLTARNVEFKPGATELVSFDIEGK